jgi:hypothetical protein
MRFFQTRLVIASGVFWCAFMGAGVALRPAQNNAPAAPELSATPTVVRTHAITPELSFEQRWQVPTPQFTPWIVDQDEPPEPEAEQRSARRAEKHHDSVSGTRGAIFTSAVTRPGGAGDKSASS